jgi:hypothetical protein
MVMVSLATVAQATPQYQDILDMISLVGIIDTIGWILAIIVLSITLKR